MNEAYISVMDALYIGIRSWRRKGCRPSDDYDPEEYYEQGMF